MTTDTDFTAELVELPNPIPLRVRGGVYLGVVIIAALVLVVPDVLTAIQTGAWGEAAASVNATLTLIAGLIATQNLR